MSRQRQSGSPRAGAASRGAGDRIQGFRAEWARELPDLDTEPMDLIGRAYRAASSTRRAIEGSFARFGLDSGEFDVVGTLLRAGPPYQLTPTELYTGLMVSSGGLTHRLIRLARAGLIARSRSPIDGRSLLVTLTGKGRKLAEKAFRADMALEQQLLDGLAPASRRRIAAALRELGAVIDANVERLGASATPTAARRRAAGSGRRRPSAR